MLELPLLIIQPWEPDAPRAWKRNLLDVEGRHVGSARREPAWAGSLAWLSPPVLSVREADDEPLVFTARRSWLFAFWEVHDAEEYPVGWITGSVLQDRWERTLAVRATLLGEGGLRFLAPGGDELASVQAGKGEVRLHFGPLVEGDPFARMLLLAAVLTAK